MSNHRIMIIEDDLVSATYLQGILAEKGYDVPDIIASGREVSGLIDALKPDLLLVDIFLGGRQDGIEIVENIARPNDIPVIYLTAYSDPGTLARAKRTEPYGFLLKPVNKSELFIAVEFALYRHTMEKKFRRSEERYRKFFNLDLVGSAIVATNGRWLQVNDRLCSMLGYTRDELLRMTWLDLTPPEDLDAEMERYRRVLEEPAPGATLKKRYVTKWGRHLHVEVSTQAIAGADGAPDYFVSLIQDITERVKTEEALRASEEMFFKVFHANPVSMSIASADTGRFIDVNPSYEAFIGYERNELIGKNSPDFNMFADKEVRDGIFKSLALEGYARNREVRIRIRSGDIRTVILSVEKINIRQEWCYLAIAYDITERLKAERAIRTSEEKFYKAFHANPLGMAITSVRESRFIDVNGSYSAFSGYRREELIGHTASELDIYADSREGIDVRLMLVRDGYVKNREIKLRVKSGEIRTVVFSTDTLILNDELCNISILQDITDSLKIAESLHESERKYRLLVETINDGLVQCDADWAITFANDRFCEILGYEKDRIIGSSLMELVQETDRESFQDELRSGRPERKNAFEVALWSLSGEKVYTIGSPRPVYNDAGTIAGCVTVFTDITDLRRLEREVLEISMREQQRIGRDLHDDLGQILTGIGFLCESLVKKLSNRSQPEAAEARNIFSLITTAKKHTRTLSHGLSPVEVDSGGIAAALDRLVRSVESVYPVVCTLECDPRIDINDSMVETQFHYIVQESVTNAINHGCADHIGVTLRQANGQVHLKIDDDGIGIPEDTYLLKGMGIRIMRYRANAIGASLKIARKPEGGTTVTCVW